MIEPTKPECLQVERRELEPWQLQLLDAAQAIVERGFAKNTRTAHEFDVDAGMAEKVGAHCYLGAMDRAHRNYNTTDLAHRRLFDWLHDNHPEHCAPHGSLKHAQYGFAPRGSTGRLDSHLASWNNAPYTSKEDVVNAMRRAALEPYWKETR